MANKDLWPRGTELRRVGREMSWQFATVMVGASVLGVIVLIINISIITGIAIPGIVIALAIVAVVAVEACMVAKLISTSV